MADLNISCGDVILSLGTSDTAIYCSSSFSPLERGHVFIHPTNPHQFVYLIWSVSPSLLQSLLFHYSYKNGSLTRERIRQKCNLSWDSVSDALKKTPVGNDGTIGEYRFILSFFYSILSGIYFDMDEIEPRVQAGDYRWNEKGERVEVK